MVLIALKYAGFGREINRSFRPLAGIMVLIDNMDDTTLVRFKKTVSVPLRGLWFLSTDTLYTYIRVRLHSFRPLAGIMVLIIQTRIIEDVHDYDGFRPLAGIMVLILTILISYAVKHVLVSVPLRGLWFLSIANKIKYYEEKISFRPLAGIMVLITD